MMLFPVKMSNCSVVCSNDDITVINDTAGVPDIVNVRILVYNVAANATIETSSTLSYVNQKFAIANRFQYNNDSSVKESLMLFLTDCREYIVLLQL